MRLKPITSHGGVPRKRSWPCTRRMIAPAPPSPLVVARLRRRLRQPPSPLELATAMVERLGWERLLA